MWQNQLSSKDRQIEGLQNEQKAFRQRMETGQASYQALERKFEVADAEIIYLTTERDRLEQTIITLEKQAKDLEAARNEARKSSLEMTAQYLKIVEMAGKLREREALTYGQNIHQGDSETSSSKLGDQGASASSRESTQARILVLEQEVKRLQTRNLQLENAVTAAKQATQNVEWILNHALEDSES